MDGFEVFHSMFTKYTKYVVISYIYCAFHFFNQFCTIRLENQNRSISTLYIFYLNDYVCNMQVSTNILCHYDKLETSYADVVIGHCKYIIKLSIKQLGTNFCASFKEKLIFYLTFLDFTFFYLHFSRFKSCRLQVKQI